MDSIKILLLIIFPFYTPTLGILLVNCNRVNLDSFDDPSTISNFNPDFYHLVVLDIRTPKMNGFKLYGEIKNIDSMSKLWFLIVSDETFYQ
jgi:DNA-binding LytR/AlgR family response regulator